MHSIFLSCVSKEFHGSPTDPWPGSYRTQLAHFLQECGQQVVYQETFAQGGGDLLAKLDDYIATEKRRSRNCTQEPLRYYGSAAC